MYSELYEASHTSVALSLLSKISLINDSLSLLNVSAVSHECNWVSLMQNPSCKNEEEGGLQYRRWAVFLAQ